jgi:hypothetical protein
MRPYFITLILAAATCQTFTASLQAQQGPLRPGSYRCFTTNMAPPGPAINPRDPDWRKSQGLPELESGQRATPPMQVPGVMIMPAFFGNILIDGKGTYKLTRSGHTGKYGFNKAAAVPTFTGDLKVMKVQGYDSSVGRFFLVYQSLAFQCSGGLTSSSTQNKSTPTGPGQKSGLTVTAATLTGLFRGNYVCTQGPEDMWLDTRATDDGVMVAVFSFGGNEMKPSGSYRLRGKWADDGFSLAPDEWIKQPSPRDEMVVLTGTLTARGIGGSVYHSGCSTFDLARQRSAGK